MTTSISDPLYLRPIERRVRADALPEHICYRDDGCEVHSHCLSCPLPRCRYDEPGGLRSLLNSYRDQEVLALRHDGLPVEEIARRFRLSRRTVFRILAHQGDNLTKHHTNGDNGDSH